MSLVNHGPTVGQRSAMTDSWLSWFNNGGVNLLLYSALLVLCAVHIQSRMAPNTISLARVDCPTCRSVSQLQRSEAQLASRLG